MGLFIMAPGVFPKGYKSDKEERKKAFVEGRIIVEKVIEEGQMFVEHPIFCILILVICFASLMVNNYQMTAYDRLFMQLNVKLGQKKL